MCSDSSNNIVIASGQTQYAELLLIGLYGPWTVYRSCMYMVPGQYTDRVCIWSLDSIQIVYVYGPWTVYRSVCIWSLEYTDRVCIWSLDSIQIVYVYGPWTVYRSCMYMVPGRWTEDVNNRSLFVVARLFTSFHHVHRKDQSTFALAAGAFIGVVSGFCGVNTPSSRPTSKCYNLV